MILDAHAVKGRGRRHALLLEIQDALKCACVRHELIVKRDRFNWHVSPLRKHKSACDEAGKSGKDQIHRSAEAYKRLIRDRFDVVGSIAPLQKCGFRKRSQMGLNSRRIKLREMPHLPAGLLKTTGISACSAEQTKHVL